MFYHVDRYQRWRGRCVIWTPPVTAWNSSAAPMARALKDLINPDRALVFRITHRDNVRWALENGLHCRNSTVRQPDFVRIGNSELIEKRNGRVIPIEPRGTLSDYVPFYFTSLTPMFLNINTGYRGIRQYPNSEIVILVSSLRRLSQRSVPFIFSDRHAYMNAARFSSDLDDLDRIDWDILQRRDFKRDNEDLEKVERYEAEALVWKHLPVENITGLGVINEREQIRIAQLVKDAGLNVPVRVVPELFF